MAKGYDSLYKDLVVHLESLRKENSNLFTKLQRNKFQVLKLLIKIVEEIDPYTKGHSLKVYRYVVKLARKLHLSKKESEIIGRAALLHDIGKIVVDKKILNKKGKLTKQEFAVIKTHPLVGVEIVKEVEHLAASCPHILYHHSKFNGEGYPKHRLGRDIPIGARIIAIADSYDAMTSDRPYRKAFDKEYAIKELKRCSGKQYDPRIVNIFLEILEEEDNNHNE